MKNLILFFILVSIFSPSQKIKVSETDKFTKQKIVETSFEKLTSSAMMGNGRTIQIALLKKGEKEYIRLKWASNNLSALQKDSPILLLDDKGNTYSFKNTDFTVSGRGEGSAGMYGSVLFGLNIYAEGKISDLESKNIIALRIHTIDGYVDFDINKKFQKTIPELYNIFKKEIEKTK